MKLEWLKDHYFFELNRKQQLESALNLPVAVLTGLAGLVALYAPRLACPVGARLLLLDLLVALAVVFLVVAFWNLVRTFLRYEYQEVAPATKLLSYHADLKTFHSGAGGTEEDADAEFAESLKRLYADAIEKNAFGNIGKAANLYWAKLCLAGAAVALLLAAIPYYVITSSASHADAIASHQAKEASRHDATATPAEASTAGSAGSTSTAAEQAYTPGRPTEEVSARTGSVEQVNGELRPTLATWLVGLLGISLFVGSLSTFAVWNLLHSYLHRSIAKHGWEIKESALQRLPLYPILTGVLERLFFTVLIAFDVSGAASGMGAWFAVKMAAGWSRIAGGEPQHRMLAFNGLLSTLTSLLFAVLGGLVANGRISVGCR